MIVLLSFDFRECPVLEICWYLSSSWLVLLITISSTVDKHAFTSTSSTYHYQHVNVTKQRWLLDIFRSLYYWLLEVVLLASSSSSSSSSIVIVIVDAQILYIVGRSISQQQTTSHQFFFRSQTLNSFLGRCRIVLIFSPLHLHTHECSFYCYCRPFSHMLLLLIHF